MRRGLSRPSSARSTEAAREAVAVMRSNRMSMGGEPAERIIAASDRMCEAHRAMLAAEAAPTPGVGEQSSSAARAMRGEAGGDRG